MAGSRCAFCHAERAPFGFRIPGAMSSLPDDLRHKYIWVCCAEECHDKAEERVIETAKKRGVV